MKALAATILAFGITVATANHAVFATDSPSAQGATSANKLEPIGNDRDSDIKVFLPDGKEISGEEAFARMPAVDLSIWVAGNQFFAMPDVLHAFQEKFPSGKKPTIGLITLPPGKVVDAMLGGGWQFRGKTLLMKPDVWGQVALTPVEKLKNAGMAKSYIVYMHNQLVLMVAKGNPKHIAGIDDLGRADLHVMLPNPVKEGIMKEYAKKVLEKHKLWSKLSAGKECESCAGASNVWFTSVHHREIPEGLQAGKTDVGIVWATEVKNALKNGAEVDTVPLPPEDSLINEVNYYAGSVPGTPHEKLAQDYLHFLTSEEGQAAYTKHGFIKAAPADLTQKDISN
jgi:ABC-type molybdate transport system substrate-binding protein